MPIERGQTFWCDFGQHDDSRQNGVRPCVVVQTDRLNRVENYSMTIVVPLSTKGSERIPSNVRIEPDEKNGLQAESYAKCEQIQTIPQEWLERRLGRLSSADMAKVGVALRRLLEV